MKKLLSIILVVVLLMSVMPMGLFNLTASAGTSGYYEYYKFDGEITIAYVDSSISGDVVIPSTLDGYPVTEIAGYAFYECDSITSITIPNSVTSIEERAFNCTSLKSITVDEQNQVYYSKGNCLIERESNTLILGCNNSVIPEGVISIGNRAFQDCSSLTSIQIPNSVTSIGDWAFNACKSLTSIQIPNSVTSIGDMAFFDCTSLASIQIPNSVTSIGEGAFDYTDYFNNAYNWENDVLYIGNCLIATHTWLSDSYNIKEGTTVIADYAFFLCDSLTSVTFPASVTNIGNWIFYECTSLNSITVDENNDIYYSKDNFLIERETKTLVLACKNRFIPKEVTAIGDYAFVDCEDLESITIPSSVTSIGEGAFSYCSNLTNINISNGVISIGDYAFQECLSLTSINIPNSVTSIGEGAFDYCGYLKSITIPNSVTSIGEDAFQGCGDLTIYGVSGSYAQQYADEYGIPFISTNTSTTLFPDTDKNGWYYEAVKYVAENGMMKGYANGYFGTADGIQRQDFLVMLARFDGVDLNEYSGGSKFGDVSSGSYYEAAVNWGYQNGIVTGYQNGNFGVSDMINREQIVTFLYRYANYKGLNTEVSAQSAQTINAKYADFKNVSSYAEDAVLWAIDRGVISGKNGNEIAPFAGAQRCEVAQIMYNINKNDIF